MGRTFKHDKGWGKSATKKKPKNKKDKLADLRGSSKHDPDPEESFERFYTKKR